MADSWTLTTPSGPYTLNASFSAPKYQAGGVSGPGALRRDDRNAYQRSGDGLATPGALMLNGRVWRDDQDAALIVAELDAIREAVAACSEVVRTTLGGTYTYSGIAGGPTPEVTPDGLGGWMVTVAFWPARAEPTFAPIGAPRFVAITTETAFIPTHTGSIAIPAEAIAGDLLLLRVAASRIALPGGDLTVDTPGWSEVTGDASVVGFCGAVYQRLAGNSDAGSITQITLGGGGTTARWAASISVWRPPNVAAPIEAAAWNTMTPSAPSVTTVRGNTRLVCFWDTYVDAAYVVSGMLPPASMTVRATFISGINEGVASESKVCTLVADELIVEPGSTGVRVASSAMTLFGSPALWLPVASVALASREN